MSDLEPPDDSGDWRLSLRVCYAGDAIVGAYPVWVEADDADAISPAELAVEAVDRLQLPAPVIAASPAGPQLVRLPVWLWLEGDSWTVQEASASVPGLTVTAVATPVGAVWSMGDGARVECDGPGTSWSVEAAARSVSPDCGHTYVRSSLMRPGGRYEVSVTVMWEVTWSGGGVEGSEPAMTTTASTSWVVDEVQTVIR